MTSRPISTWLFALALACSTAGAAAAQDATTITPQDLAKRDKAMRDRIDRLDKVVRSLREVIVQAKDTGQPVQIRVLTDPDPEMASAKARLDDLEQTVRTINGRLDDIAHDIDVTRKTLSDEVAARRDTNDRIEKLAARIQAVEAAAQPVAPEQPPPSEEQPAPSAAPPPAATPTEAFAQAKTLLLANDYGGAAAAFQEFVERFPNAAQAPEARYWLGETLFVQGAYADAATAYIGAIRGWPGTAWAPNATVKLAQSLLALGKPADACSTLSEFSRRYPKAPSAVSARAKAARAEGKCS